MLSPDKDTQILTWPAALLYFGVGAVLAVLITRVALSVVQGRLPAPATPPRFLAESGMLAIALFLGLSLLAPLALSGQSSVGTDQPGQAEQVEPGMLTNMIVTLALNVLVVVGVCLHARRVHGASLRDLGLRTAPPVAFGFALLMAFALAPAFRGAAMLNAKLIETFGLAPHQEVIRKLLEDPELLRNPFILFGAVVLVPMLEEAIFRGFLLRAIGAVMGPVAAVVGSSVLFAVAHDIQSAFPIFVVGVILGIVALRTQSILPAALLHSGFNGVQIAAIASLQHSAGA